MKRLKKIIDSKLKLFLSQLKELLDFEKEDNKRSLNRRHSRYFEKENKELITGSIVIFLVLVILFSIGYYFLIFSPSMEELENQKNIKINEVNSIFKDNLTSDPTKQALLSQINSASSVEDLESMDIESMVYPVLKNQLLSQIDQMKDKYGRIQISINGSSNIMNVKNATAYINSSTANELSSISIMRVDSVIIPLSINRKQAASGLLSEGDVVDIYKNNQELGSYESTDVNESVNNSSINTTENESTISLVNNSSGSSKLVGGAKVVSLLRSKDSGSIDSNIELSESPTSRNFSQSNTLDIEEILSSKAAGTLDEKQLNILLSKYGVRLSNYERTSNLGDLDVEYIIMVEVPRESVDNILNNMDNIILTIPTYNAPSWVNLTK